MTRWWIATACVLALCLQPSAHATQSKYLLTLLDAKIQKSKANKRRWDGGFGNMTLPDVYVQFEIGGKRYTTLIKKNTLSPSWKQTWVLESSPKTRLYIKVMDKDMFGSDDLIGEADVLLGKLPAKMVFGQVRALRFKLERLSPGPKKKPPTSQATTR